MVFPYTPTHRSWLNPIESGLSLLVRKLLQRGAFTSRDARRAQVLACTAYDNRTMVRPFEWTYQGRVLTR
jgi:putative transposase